MSRGPPRGRVPADASDGDPPLRVHRGRASAGRPRPPARHVRVSDGVPGARRDRIEGRDAIRVRLSFDRAAPMFPFLRLGGTWRPFFDRDAWCSGSTPTPGSRCGWSCIRRAARSDAGGSSGTAARWSRRMRRSSTSTGVGVGDPPAGPRCSGSRAPARRRPTAPPRGPPGPDRLPPRDPVDPGDLELVSIALPAPSATVTPVAARLRGGPRLPEGRRASRLVRPRAVRTRGSGRGAGAPDRWRGRVLRTRGRGVRPTARDPHRQLGPLPRDQPPPAALARDRVLAPGPGGPLPAAWDDRGSAGVEVRGSGSPRRSRPRACRRRSPTVSRPATSSRAPSSR